MRHAKSSWEGKHEDDRERPLSKRGKKNAAQMGELLKEEKFTPDLILSSSAVRARVTAEVIMDTLGYHGDVCFLNSLYLAEVDAYLKELRRLDDHVDCVLIISHNPGLESLLQTMVDKIEALPTASVAYLNIHIDSWKDYTGDSQAELVKVWKPKDL